MSEPAVLIERDGFVATVTMNRPDVRNAINPEMVVRLADAWEEVDNDDSVRVVILTGAGGNFCAGADLDRLVGRLTRGEPPEDEWEERVAADWEVIYRGLLRAYRVRKPLIAAVEGFALAGGTEILQGTDIRVAGESAEFGVTEARWGLFPMGGSTVRLKRQIGYTKAMEMLLTAGRYKAPDCLSFGLIGNVVADGQALAKARELAGQICRNGPLAVRKIKESAIATEYLPEKEALEIEFGIGIQVMASEDAREGPKAFKEKREPDFKGR